MDAPACVKPYPELVDLVRGADHVDVQSVACDAPLRSMLAACLSYMPGWLRFLYRVRVLVARLLGLQPDMIPHDADIRPETISMTPGDKVAVMRVVAALEDVYWVGEAADRHLAGSLVLVRETDPAHGVRCHLATVVRYRHWTGPVYFNLIRPFHHLVVFGLLRNVARRAPGL